MFATFIAHVGHDHGCHHWAPFALLLATAGIVAAVLVVRHRRRPRLLRIDCAAMRARLGLASEENMRKALDIAVKIPPCVWDVCLWDVGTGERGEGGAS